MARRFDSIGCLRKGPKIPLVPYGPKNRHERNGDLLTACGEAGFEVLLTTDNSIRYQQNMAARRIAIVVLSRNRWSMAQRTIPRIVEAVNAATPDSYTIIDIPFRSAVRCIATQAGKADRELNSEYASIQKVLSAIRRETTCVP